MNNQTDKREKAPLPASGKKTLGILQAGRSPEELLERYPDYNQLFIDMLGESSFHYKTWAVLDNEFPLAANDADAWLITGSRHGAYEPHAWIPPLEHLIREIYSKGVPMVGICFGHQIIAQALGGTVEKFSGGWSVGRVEYALDSAIWGEDTTAVAPLQAPLMAFHQDQVIEPPAQAITIGSSQICRHAALVYDSRILTIQPHPEFDRHFVNGLLQARKDLLPENIFQQANKTLQEPLSRDPVIQTIKSFLEQPPTTQQSAAASEQTAADQ